MRSDRGINTAVGAFRGSLKRCVVERFAHAVQALKFKRTAIVVSELQYRRHGVCVVRGELGENTPLGIVGKQELRAGKVGHIGARFTGAETL